MRRSFRLNEGQAPGRRAALAACLAAVALAATAAPALAVDPTTFSDNPNDGITLREAIDATAAGGTIHLAAGTFEVAQGTAGSYEDKNASGDLDVTKPLTIAGAGMDATVIRSTNPGPVDGVLHVLSSLNLSGVTITAGLRPMAPGRSEERGFGAGGGIRVGATGAAAGSLTATNVKVIGNRAFQGGGVFVSGAPSRSTADFTDSVIVGNQAAQNGGGISAEGDVRLTRTAVVGNQAANGGGLVLWQSPRGTLDAVNVTVAGNQALQRGGGLQTAGNPVNFDFSTIAANKAQGGRNLDFVGGHVNLSNSLVAGAADNSCANTRAGDISSGGFNIDQGATCLGTDTNGDGAPDAPLTPDDRIGVTDDQLKLSPLDVQNGVYWLGLGEGSAAIDTGPELCFQNVDQRGVARPQRGRCDVGAVEQEPAKVTDVGITKFEENPDPVSVGQNLVYDITVTNVGSDLARDVVVTTSIPATTTFVSASAGCSRPRPDSLRCELKDIPAGASASAQLTVKATAAGTVNNRADVSTPSTDVNRGNDQARTSATVVGGSNSGGGGGSGAGAFTFRLTKAFSKRASSARVTVTAAGAGRVTVRLYGSKSVGTLARASARFTVAGSKSVRLKFAKKAARKLRRLKTGSKLRLKVTMRPAGGRAASDTVTLRVRKNGRLRAA